MPQLAWTETVPSGTSAVGDTPNVMRSILTSLAIGLGTDLFWAGSGGGSDASLGDLRPGGSRTFVGPRSQSSNANDAKNRARAFLTSDSSLLFVYGSTGTFCVGTPYLIEHQTPAGNAVWVTQSGSTVVSSAGTPTSVVVGFPQTFDSTPRFVHVTLSERSFLSNTPVVGTGVFTSSFSYTGPGAQSSFTLSWRAIGLISGATL